MHLAPTLLLSNSRHSRLADSACHRPHRTLHSAQAPLRLRVKAKLKVLLAVQAMDSVLKELPLVNRVVARRSATVPRLELLPSEVRFSSKELSRARLALLLVAPSEPLAQVSREHLGALVEHSEATAA